MISYRNHQEHIIRAAWKYLDEHPRGIGKKLLKTAEKFVGTFNERTRRPKKTLLKAVKKNFKVRIVPGKIFSFRYNAKWAKILPYYDRYPFILVLKRNARNKTFTGLNLHYINPFYRKELLNAIDHLYTAGMDRYYVKDFFGDIASWARRFARPCLHMYRMDRVMNLHYWNIPTLMGMWVTDVNDQTFIRSGLMRVWMDSRKKMMAGQGRKIRRRMALLAKSKAKLAKKRATAKRKMQARIKSAAKGGNLAAQKQSKSSRQSKAGKLSVTSRKSKARTGRISKRKKK